MMPHNFIMNKDIPIPPAHAPPTNLWDRMDKTDPYSMIMKCAALQGAVEVLTKPELKRSNNSPGPLSRARIEDREEETTSDQEEEEYNTLWKSIKNCTEADSSWGLYEYKAVFRAPIHFAEFYKKSMDDVVTTQCKIDGGEVKSVTFSDVKNR